MAKVNLPVPQRTPIVVPVKSATPIIINTQQPIRSPRRWAVRHPSQITIGGGAIFPKIKCSRKDLGVAVLAIGGAAALVYGAKCGCDYLKSLWARKAEESQAPIPVPPKVEAVINCVNSAGKPKEPLVPDMVYEGSISVIAGRPNGGKTLLAQQLAIELARGDGDLVGEGVPPQNVIIVDGEMDDDDYKRRFGGEDMVVPSNITRISDCDFSTLKQLTSYLKKLVDGLLGPAVIIIDNIQFSYMFRRLVLKNVVIRFNDAQSTRFLFKLLYLRPETLSHLVVEHISVKRGVNPLLHDDTGYLLVVVIKRHNITRLLCDTDMYVSEHFRCIR